MKARVNGKMNQRRKTTRYSRLIDTRPRRMASYSRPTLSLMMLKWYWS